ncbi:hypothetical protein TWF730_005836 [Orbilia blumenaviensis]|uniref:Uncharacterized protein n=1 Tax=Orbilia blumenaviensis TaxID=1796055 RepID=A0AAV9VLV7_9PEZI
MSQKKNNDLLEFGQDIKRMSADNITPPDTAAASKLVSHEETDTGDITGESKTPVKPTDPLKVGPDVDRAGTSAAAGSEQMGWRKDGSE